MKRLFIVVWIMLLSGEGLAHIDQHPKKMEVLIHEDGIRLALVYRISPGPPSNRLRHDVDLDKNGFLDQEETERLKRRLIGYATFGLRIQINHQNVGYVLESTSLSAISNRVSSGKPLVLKMILIHKHRWSKEVTSLILHDYLPIRTQLINGKCRARGVGVEPCGSFHLSEADPYQVNVSALQ